jgi:predicted NBD/HSP70 family sugar kinase
MAPSESSGTTTAIGVDVGGTGIKGAPVDVARGELAADRVRLLTPSPATPERVTETVADVLGQVDAAGPIGRDRGQHRSRMDRRRRGDALRHRARP